MGRLGAGALACCMCLCGASSTCASAASPGSASVPLRRVVRVLADVIRRDARARFALHGHAVVVARANRAVRVLHVHYAGTASEPVSYLLTLETTHRRVRRIAVSAGGAESWVTSDGVAWQDTWSFEFAVRREGRGNWQLELSSGDTSRVVSSGRVPFGGVGGGRECASSRRRVRRALYERVLGLIGSAEHHRPIDPQVLAFSECDRG